MEFRPLHPDLGAEVLGFDLQNGRSEADIAQLRAAYDRYSMLLFRGQGQLSHERHYELASWFGPPPPVDNLGNGEYVTELRNEEAAGSLRLPFHSDLTYTDDPIRAICLQAIALPENPTSTTYVSGMAAWRRLPEEMRAKLDGLTLRHVLETFAMGYDWPTFIADHPVKFVHPRTGDPILLVTETHATRILELEEEDSAATLSALFDALYAPEWQYDHVWQLNDVLLWDNMALQHARKVQSDPGEGRRVLQRVALSNLTLDETIERARAREGA